MLAWALFVVALGLFLVLGVHAWRQEKRITQRRALRLQNLWRRSIEAGRAGVPCRPPQ